MFVAISLLIGLSTSWVSMGDNEKPHLRRSLDPSAPFSTVDGVDIVGGLKHGDVVGTEIIAGTKIKRPKTRLRSFSRILTPLGAGAEVSSDGINNKFKEQLQSSKNTDDQNASVTDEDGNHSSTNSASAFMARNGGSLRELDIDARAKGLSADNALAKNAPKQKMLAFPKSVRKITKFSKNCFVEAFYFRNGTTLAESCGLNGKSMLREFQLVPTALPRQVGPTTRAPSWLENVPKPYILTKEKKEFFSTGSAAGAASSISSPTPRSRPVSQSTLPKVIASPPEGEGSLVDTLSTDAEHSRTAPLPKEIFGEGAVDLGDYTYSLCYHCKVLFSKEDEIRVFKKHDWTSLVKKLPWPHGEGWGLTTDGCRLLGTTGDPYIYHINPENGALLKKILVKDTDVHPVNRIFGRVRMLNEIEFIPPRSVWVNIWLTNTIIRVDIWTGFVEKKINLDVTKKMWKGEATPNGIAYHYDFEPVSLLVTGKLWDAMYVLELTDNELCGDGWSMKSWEGITPTSHTPVEHKIGKGDGEVCPNTIKSPCWKQGGPNGDKSSNAAGAKANADANAAANTVSTIVTTNAPSQNTPAPESITPAPTATQIASEQTTKPPRQKGPHLVTVPLSSYLGVTNGNARPLSTGDTKEGNRPLTLAPSDQSSWQSSTVVKPTIGPGSAPILIGGVIQITLFVAVINLYCTSAVKTWGVCRDRGHYVRM